MSESEPYDLEEYLSARVATVLKRMGIPLAEVGKYPVQHFMAEANFGRRSLADLSRACALLGHDPPLGYEDWWVAKAAVEEVRRDKDPKPITQPPVHAKLPPFTAEDLMLSLEGLIDRMGNDRLEVIAANRLLPGASMKLTELGEIYGVSRERIRQLELRAFVRMRVEVRHSPLLVALSNELNAGHATFNDAALHMYDLMLGRAREDTAFSLATILVGILGNAKSLGIGYRQLMPKARTVIGDFRRERRRAERRAFRAERRSKAYAARCLSLLECIFSSAAWPAEPRILSSIPPRSVGRAREINFDEDGSNKGVFRSMRQGYGDVHYDSGLEYTVLSAIDASTREVPWYMEQPLAIPFFTEKERRRVHYPDILLMSASGRLLLVEGKPIYRMLHLDTFIKGKVALEHAWSRGWGYVITDERGRTLKLLYELPSFEREDEFVSLVRKTGEMKNGKFQQIRMDMEISYTDCCSAMLRHDLVHDTLRRMVTSLPPGQSWRSLCGVSVVDSGLAA
ncbi:sigma factor-like helix-turn-helix DNA-binding protein [Microvirga splendida]|uniref:RNA polymerase sigma-70 region 4 domain-containing protein n=1 Tax=Microvirga splendida TaxID=2795727 RepID=A0ABS0XZD3_9HYPH|nr:sigma factor-like helix-turn-helix DNA-binding protein [Microvirga splendida]MBJ6125393.1 hypothetical protein [Microvirga splendida]